MILLLLYLYVTIHGVLGKEKYDYNTEQCGYNSCTDSDPEKLNVHIVPHTHNDVGWIKTFDEYYNDDKTGLYKYFHLRNRAFKIDINNIYIKTTKEKRFHSLLTATWATTWMLICTSIVWGCIYMFSFLMVPRETCDLDIYTNILLPYGSSGMLLSIIIELFPDDYEEIFSSQKRKSHNRLGGVKLILNSVIKELWQDKKRRFMYVETAFFWKWWMEQDDSVKNKVKTLVKEGRLQFVGGAWSMNDEASCHYQSIIDDFTWGLSKLNETFGQCGMPRVGWQIDPFGHSREFASLLSAMGYDGLFLGRIDYQDKGNRMTNKHMEMLWRGNDDLGKSSDIFTGVLFNTYSPPPGFCFDIVCQDEPINDDVNSPMYNVNERVKQLMDYAESQSKYYKTKNVILTMGGDFTYKAAGMWYSNLDLIIKHANLKAAKKNLKIKLFYSTPDCYLKAVKDANPTLPIKQDDFFPYASDPHAFWTGYFTSRPTNKRFDREGNNFLQMVKQLQVINNLEAQNELVINELKSAMGIMQHHDAITGTEKQYVANDYVRMLDKAIQDTMVVVNQGFNKMLHGDTNAGNIEFTRCPFNESSCAISENSDSFMITLYNPLAWVVKDVVVRVPVKDGSYEVKDLKGTPITTQLVEINSAIKNIPTRRSEATHEIVFLTNVKPLRVATFNIRRSNQVKRETRMDRRYDYNGPNEKVNNQLGAAEIVDQDLMIADEAVVVEKESEDTVIGNNNLKLHMNNTTGQISHIEIGNVVKTFNLEIMEYLGYQGFNRGSIDRASGAYIFRPTEDKPNKLKITFKAPIKGSIVEEMQYNGDFVSGALRLYQGDNTNYLEHDWLVGPIPIDDQKGREIVVRYYTDIINNGEFYTDSNGRQMIKRQLGTRPQWNLTLEEPVSGNYYPVTNQIYVEDDNLRLSVITDRAQGGTSLNEGEIELMVHRRLLYDDSFGVGEALNESVEGKGLFVRGTHKITIFNSQNKDSVIKDKVRVFETDHQCIQFVSGFSKKQPLITEIMKEEFLSRSLPSGIHLLTLEPWGDQSMLLRLENYLHKTDPDISSIKVDLSKLLNCVQITKLREATLAVNTWLEDHSKWSWKTDEEFDNYFNVAYGSFGQKQNASEVKKSYRKWPKIELKAKEIRTFVISYKLKFKDK